MTDRPSLRRLAAVTVVGIALATPFALRLRAQTLPSLPLLTPWAQSAARPAYRPGELTVRFRTTVSLQRADDVMATMGSRVVYSARYVPGLHVVTVPDGMGLAQAIAAYRGRADVEYAEPNYVDYPFLVPDDPQYYRQWHLGKIGCPTAWDTTLGSTSVIVALIDTGVAFTDRPGHPHAPDLEGTAFVAPWDAVDGDSFPVDDEGHGTHVCGTIAQTTNNNEGVAGVAPGVSIMPIRSLGPNGGTHAQFYDACRYAADNGAHVINYSAGGSDSQTKQDAVAYAYGKGVLICAAMGNDGVLDSDAAYPGRYPEVIGVAASTVTNQRAYYSNYGSDVDLTGPGGDTTADLDADGFPDGVLQNTFPSGSPAGGFGYRYMMGTSMATPHVTGAAALVYAEMLRRGLSPTADGVRSVLEQTAEDLGASGRDDYFGHGLVRADLAVGTLSAPLLEWVGSGNYVSDGVSPDKAVASSEFRFRVKYTDPDGQEPAKAVLRIQKLACGGIWEAATSAKLVRNSGAPETGAIYYAAANLPNETYRYRFDLETAEGDADGEPSRWTLGPMIVDTPVLCWVGTTGYVSDGVKPNSGPTGTTFAFQALYRDSRGDAPTTRNVAIRRNGKHYRTIEMGHDGGPLQTGRTFSAETQLKETGSYEYRFVFADASGSATGDPTDWKTGPQIDGTAGAAQVTAASAVQTRQGGAQIVFTLSEAAAVSARVLNIAGREVRTVARDHELGAGVNSLLWDGRSDAGLMAPAGTYIVQLEAAGKEGTRSRAIAVLTVRR